MLASKTQGITCPGKESLNFATSTCSSEYFYRGWGTELFASFSFHSARYLDSLNPRQVVTTTLCDLYVLKHQENGDEE